MYLPCRKLLNWKDLQGTNTLMEKIRKACQLLSQEARELYLPREVAEFDGEDEPVDPLRFYRNNVSRNLPLLIKNGCSKWPGVGKWGINYFRNLMKNKQVNVAVTPNGYADAVTLDKNGDEYFVMPEECIMKMTDFLDNLQHPSEDICYIQQQNSNFQNDFFELWKDVDNNFSWANKAFGKDPDAINFWMGDERAITSMHKDPYENIYCVLSGRKTFILHPPTDLPWIPYEKYKPAKFKKVDSNWTIEPIASDELIPWIPVDPLNPDYTKYPEYKNSNRLIVNVEAGDVLYLPSLWFHHVQQSHACIAVNFWYDMDYDIKYAYYKSLELLCQ